MSGAAGDSQLFEDSFTITNVDQSKYDRVARIYGTSADAQTVMSLDINTELFPCLVGENLTVVLATTLSLDGTRDDDKGWRRSVEARRARIGRHEPRRHVRLRVPRKDLQV